MERIPKSPPVIAPLPASQERPLWSVMIPTYNCFQYIREALESVMLQDPGERVMQIEVVDDCSTDGDVEKLVEEVSKGRIRYYRQPVNGGSLRNFETCINRAQGHLIHLLHGDDFVKPGFYKKMAELFERYPDAGAAYCAYEIIDEKFNEILLKALEAEEDCILDNWFYKLAQTNYLQYAATVVKRTTYEKLGSFYAVTYGEDWEMWVRIAKNFPVAYTPEYLAAYRIHHNSISLQSYLTGKNIKDIATVIELIKKHLPEKDQKQLTEKAKRIHFSWALDNSRNLWIQTKKNRMVLNQVFQIMKRCRDYAMVKKSAKLISEIVFHPLRPVVPHVSRLKSRAINN